MLDPPVTIRLANPLDRSALAALAQLDSAEQLAPPVIVAEIGGHVRAALSLWDTKVIADPFHPSSELVDLLRIRARQLTTEPDAGPFTALRSALAALLPRATAAGGSAATGR